MRPHYYSTRPANNDVFNLDNPLVEAYISQLTQTTTSQEESMRTAQTLTLWDERRKLKEDMKALAALRSGVLPQPHFFFN
jgi:vesicle coat complex subunit